MGSTEWRRRICIAICLIISGKHWRYTMVCWRWEEEDFRTQRHSNKTITWYFSWLISTEELRRMRDERKRFSWEEIKICETRKPEGLCWEMMSLSLVRLSWRSEKCCRESCKNVHWLFIPSGRFFISSWHVLLLQHFLAVYDKQRRDF